MGTGAANEVARLLKAGKTLAQIRVDLENTGYSTDDVLTAISDESNFDGRTMEERKNARLLSVREVFDRVGYGGATPQFVNILFYLSQMTHPLILAIIGLLNGLKTLLTVLWSSLLQEYGKIQRVRKNTIATAGIIFGFSFLFMSFGLLLHNMWMFSVAFLVGTVGIVAYGDLYHKFVTEVIRKERMGAFLHSIAHWGVLITAVTLVLSGYLLDAFPLAGTSWQLVLFGKTFNLKVYGYLLAFEITAFAFIISGYVNSLLVDTREERTYPFWRFCKEYYHITKSKMHIFADKYVLLLTLASVITGFLQIIITSYAGIQIYQVFAKQYSAPFYTLGIVYAIAIIASFTGPFFTQKTHRSIGLAPTMVFGTLLCAILPLVLVYNQNIVAIALGLCTAVIGSAILGFGQGMLAQKMLDEENRRTFFQAQSFVVFIPYLILIPAMAYATTLFPLATLFLVVAGALIIVVMPIYFLLVTISQKMKL